VGLFCRSLFKCKHLFWQGRTETVRSLSNESAAFVDAMMDASSSPAERVKKVCAYMCVCVSVWMWVCVYSVHVCMCIYV